METTSRSEYTKSPNTNTSKAPKKIPKPMPSKSDPLTCPITFIQADPNSFKQVVQHLTGPSKQSPTDQNRGSFKNIPVTKTEHMKLSTSNLKLYERRNRNRLLIMPSSPRLGRNVSKFSPKIQEVLSPSLLDFPSLSLSVSPVTPLIKDPFGKSDNNSPPNNSEERGEAVEPRLLPLFPVTPLGRNLRFFQG